MMTHRWRDVTRDHPKKTLGDLNYVWTKNDSHQPPLNRIAKIDRCGIVGAEILLINSVLKVKNDHRSKFSNSSSWKEEA